MAKIDIYLAGPYSHDDEAVQQWRCDRLTEAAAILFNRGFESIYSPITHTHPITQLPHIPIEHTYDRWLTFDFAFLANCKELAVLMLPGWEKSIGVAAELDFAVEHDIPVLYITPIYDPMFRVIDMEIH